MLSLPHMTVVEACVIACTVPYHWLMFSNEQAATYLAYAGQYVLKCSVHLTGD